MPTALRSELLALNRSGDDEMPRSALAANEVARLYAKAVNPLLSAAELYRAVPGAICL